MYKYIKKKNKEQKKGKIPYDKGFYDSKLSTHRVLTKMNKIYATLDLNKSLEEFKENVTKILELTDIENWDGVKIKKKEEEIRNIALILAGQCIAILLYNLSDNAVAINTANKKTQVWWRAKTKNHGYKKRQILTIGNVELNIKLPYVVERNNKNNKTNKRIIK